MISLDCETTGVDHFHGAKPFLATTCGEDGKVAFWEWDVDPYTREPQIPAEDLDEVRGLLESNDLVLQNCKFDAHAVATILPGFEWPWERTDDTLIAAHLLASNQQKDLTTLALVYLGINIEPLELACKEACVEARRLVRTAPQFRPKTTMDLFSGVSTSGEWHIAKKGLPEMPSAKESTWKYDLWLPRAVAKHLGYADYHPWWRVCSEYANGDSQVTLPIWLKQRQLLEDGQLIHLYREKVRELPVMWEMERRGTTVLVEPLKKMREEYRRDMQEQNDACVRIADKRGYELKLPKAGNNKSLTTFAFDVLKLPTVKLTDSGAPSLDREVLDVYKNTLDPGSDGHRFVKHLSGMRKRAKSCEYLDAYAEFGIPRKGVLVLHPSVNPTATATTRKSMSNPNLQQVSKQESECEECHGDGCEACEYSGEDLHSVRKCFGPGPGREYWSMDAKNIELRIPAFESGERSLIELFERPNDPPFYGSQHMLNMSIVYADVWQEELRRVGPEKVAAHCKKKYGAGGQPYHCSKCGGLAMQYQCGESTADKAFRRKGGYAKLKAFFSKVDALNDRWVAFARKHGYVETMPDRSLGGRGYPLQCSRVSWGGVKPTVPLNYHVQGTAGWWMVRAMTRCYEQLLEWRRRDGFDGFIALTVHDELVFDFPRGRGKEPWKTHLPKIAKLQKLMEQGGRDIGVPTPVSRTYHPNNWSEGEDI